MRNLASRNQVMTRQLRPLRLMNTYGLFGQITRTRYEVVIEGTDDATPGPDAEWKEYEFKAKPGDPRRRPRQVAPYHLRLDWLMWFAALSPAYAGAWLLPLVEKLLMKRSQDSPSAGRQPLRGGAADLRPRPPVPVPLQG